MAKPNTASAYATITNPSSTLTDYTALIDLTDLPALTKADWNSDDGGRGRAYKYGTATELACDFIDSDYSAGTGVLAVKWTGNLENSGTQQVQIFLPNTGSSEYLSSDTYGSDNAYKAAIKGLYPLQADGNDRTSNANNLTAYNTPSYVAGPIGKMADLNGTNQYYEADITPVSDRPFSVLAYFQHDDEIQSSYEVVCYYGNQSNDDWFLTAMNSENMTAWDRYQGPTASSSGTDYADGNGHTIATSFYANGSSQPVAEIYIDGTFVADSTVAITAITPSFDRLSIGRAGDSSPGFYWTGGLAFIVVIDEQPSAAYIDEWDAMFDQSTFWGTWTNVPVSVGGNPWYYYSQQ